MKTCAEITLIFFSVKKEICHFGTIAKLFVKSIRPPSPYTRDRVKTKSCEEYFILLLYVS